MTAPISPPSKKNPQKRTPVPASPPQARSRAALGLSAAAAQGQFKLQVCQECAAIQYPPRDACAQCLSTALQWSPVSPLGQLIADTIVRVSPNAYFRDSTPWRTGTVKLDAGPSIICHVHGDCIKGELVRLINRLDRGGQGVLMALPLTATPNMEDDPQMRELTCDPKFRRVLITDGRSDTALALARALAKAGAETVFVGEAEAWRDNPVRAQLLALPQVQLVPLDVTNTASVTALAAQIGGKVDILINNARFVRPGGVIARGDTVFAQQELEVNYLGLMRLAQSFGPAMRARGTDGQNNAIAWVNILSVYAYANQPDFGCFAASNAAALSLTQCLRAEVLAGGIRVMNAFTGPTDDDWHQPLPAPKVTASALARAIVAALKDGLEDVFVGEIAQDLYERWRADPKVLELEMTAGGGA